MYMLLWSFFVFSFAGWIIEVVFAAIKQKKLINRGFLAGPYCPVFGFGMSGIILIAHGLRFSLAFTMVASFIFVILLELFSGILLEQVFRQKWWDYSNHRHNYRGYISIKLSVLWCVTGVIMAEAILPYLSRLIRIIPVSTGKIILLAMAAVIAIDFIITALAIISLNRKLKILEILSGKVEGKASEKTSVQVRRLKEKYDDILKANRLHVRIIKAFPSLHSLKHNAELEDMRSRLHIISVKSSRSYQNFSKLAAQVYESPRMRGREVPFAHGLCYSKLFCVFMIGSFLGFVFETIYALILPPHQFELRVSVVFGPFIIVYGFGAVLMTLLLYKMYNQKDILIFLASMVIGATFEFVSSFFQQATMGTVSWEYSDSFLNVGGRTNLMYAFFWGILGLFWIKDIYPFMSIKIQRIPKKLGIILTVLLSVFMVVNMVLSMGAVMRQSQRINNIPATNSLQIFFDKYFPDSYLEIIYPNMQYVGAPDITQLSSR